MNYFGKSCLFHFCVMELNENMQNQLDQLMKKVYNIEKDKSTDCYINSAFNAYYVFKCNFLLSGKNISKC